MPSGTGTDAQFHRSHGGRAARHREGLLSRSGDDPSQPDRGGSPRSCNWPSTVACRHHAEVSRSRPPFYEHLDRERGNDQGARRKVAASTLIVSEATPNVAWK